MQFFTDFLDAERRTGKQQFGAFHLFVFYIADNADSRLLLEFAG